MDWLALLAVSAAAAAAKSLQSCPTLCDPGDGSPPGSPVPGILKARTQVGCHFLLQCMKVKSESEVSQSCPTPSDPMDCSLPAPPSMGFSRQEYWSGLPLPSPQVLLVVKNLPANAGDRRDLGLIPGSGRYPGERCGSLFQYSCLENLLDRGLWWAIVHEVAKSQT